MENGKATAKSPRVTHIEWGRIDAEGVGTARDMKLYPGGGREWNWKETNTHHDPGIQPADVAELLENGSEVIVLTRGMHLVLQICPETEEMLKDRAIPYHILETNEAVKLYNELAETKAVGGLFHSTC